MGQFQVTFTDLKIWNVFWRIYSESAGFSANGLEFRIKDTIRVITKLPNSEQSNKEKIKTHKYINRQNQSTIGKLWKPQWPWLGTGISKEMVGWIRF